MDFKAGHSSIIVLILTIFLNLIPSPFFQILHQTFSVQRRQFTTHTTTQASARRHSQFEMAPLRKALGLLILMSLLSVGLTLSLEEVVAKIEAAKKTATIPERLERECIAAAVLLNFPFISAKKLCSATAKYYIPDGKNYKALKDYEGSHYALGTIWKTWEDARDACKKINGDLVATETTEEWSHIFDELKRVDAGRPHWLGGSGKGTQGEWKWVTGGTIKSSPKGFGAWWQWSPSGNFARGMYCLMSLNPSNSRYHENDNWWDKLCTTLYPYICEY